MQLESSRAASLPERGQALAPPSEEDGGPASSPARISIRLLDNERDIDETLPLTLAAHEESRHREHPLDPARRRRFLAERFLADRTRYGFLVARYGGRPVGMLTCLAERLHYTDVAVVSCLSFYVLAEYRRTLLGGRIAVKLLDAGRRWAMNRRAVELQLHVTSGIHIGQTDRVFRKLGFRQTGGNYTLGLSPEPHRAVEQVAFDGLAVCHERVRGAIQLHRPHGLEIHLQQLAKSASFAAPAPRRAFRARTSHAGDDRADGRRAQRPGQPQLREPGAKCELVHRPQPHVLHADRARAHELQRIDVHSLDIGSIVGGVGAREQLGGDTLGVGFHLPGRVVAELELAGEDLVDPSAKGRPVVLLDLEVSSQIEQGAS